MATRRDVLKLALAGGSGTLAARRAAAGEQSHLTQFLCPPDDRARDLDNMPPSPQLREDEYYQQQSPPGRLHSSATTRWSSGSC